jgi:hypothetical protein
MAHELLRNNVLMAVPQRHADEISVCEDIAESARVSAHGGRAVISQTSTP